ncbi:Mitochondrial carrier protein [Plasmodiophora brassicae]|uniref:Mitochondrial carrier protein n=1 Tax=Plasmodiophora brassicae TaxID=37360 RepID=A0A0G4ILH7_PLABS|nr:hypothetical protein PBRA_004657 [Plasmodiophora brassicae]SPQ93485.1 unnamed protein product [Plasmodiophora brassicae]
MASGVVDIAAGSAGGLLAALVGHPFDTIKVRLQTQPTNPPLYTGFLDCVRQTASGEGLLGFYKGLQSPVIGMVLFNSVQFFAYGQAIEVVRTSFPGDHSKRLTVQQYALCGALTGVAVSAVESPMDLFKSQVQVQVFEKPAEVKPGAKQFRFTGALDAAVQIWRHNGVRGVYQGLNGTLLRNIPAVGLYFGAYEFAKNQLVGPSRNVDQLSDVELLCSGGFAGICYWLFTYPTDIIKSALQTDAVDRPARRYKGIVDCATQLYKQGGASRFFRGLTPCMIRAFPANATCFWGFETAKKALTRE